MEMVVVIAKEAPRQTMGLIVGRLAPLEPMAEVALRGVPPIPATTVAKLTLSEVHDGEGVDASGAPATTPTSSEGHVGVLSGPSPFETPTRARDFPRTVLHRSTKFPTQPHIRLRGEKIKNKKQQYGSNNFICNITVSQSYNRYKEELL